MKGVRVSVDTDAKDLNALMKALLEKTELEFTAYANRYVFLTKDRRIVNGLPAFVGWVEGKSADSGSELLQADNRKATSGNRIYVVGKRRTNRRNGR